MIDKLKKKKREATMPGRTRRILAEATGASIDRQNQRTATVGGLLSNVGVTIIIIVALIIISQSGERGGGEGWEEG